MAHLAHKSAPTACDGPQQRCVVEVGAPSPLPGPLWAVGNERATPTGGQAVEAQPGDRCGSKSDDEERHSSECHDGDQDQRSNRQRVNAVHRFRPRSCTVSAPGRRTSWRGDGTSAYRPFKPLMGADGVAPLVQGDVSQRSAPPPDRDHAAPEPLTDRIAPDARLTLIDLAVSRRTATARTVEIGRGHHHGASIVPSLRKGASVIIRTDIPSPGTAWLRPWITGLAGGARR